MSSTKVSEWDAAIITLWAERDKLRQQRDELRSAILPWMHEIRASVGASHLTDGFKPKRNNYDDMIDKLEQAIKEAYDA